MRREHLLEDTMNRLASIEEGEEAEFKKELKVLFDGEDGIDAGGVRKEYYQLMLKQLLAPDFGMFRQPSGDRQGLLWFNPDAFTDLCQEYELIGILVGIALYVLCSMFFLFLVCRVSLCLSLLIYYCLPAFFDTT